MSVHLRPSSPLSGRVDPEDGAEARRLHQLITQHGTHALLGFACDAGVRRNGGRAGAREGPAAIRQALASLAAPANMASIADLGDVVVDGDALEAGQSLLAHQLRDALARHARVVVLGGGHETAFGTHTGLRDAFPGRHIGIINIDAHLDLRTPTALGASSGTPFHQIHDTHPSQFDYLCIGVARESNTEALLQRARDWRAEVVFDRELRDDPRAADAAVRAIVQRSDVIHLSIDLDVLPHSQAPGVSAPAVRGVPLHTVERLVELLCGSCRDSQCVLPLAELVELSPPHDVDGITARTAAVLALALLAAPS